MQTINKEKSRNLSVYQFFQILQLEWIVTDLRSRIYPKKKDKDFWNKVKEGKRLVIENIADKNHLPTIFNDEEMKRHFESKVYNDKGCPSFLYKDDVQRTHQEPLDLLYYFYRGAEVRFEYYNEIKVGLIKSFIPGLDKISIQFGEETLSLPVTEVTRVL